MTALAIIPALKVGGYPVAFLRDVSAQAPFLARCPGCERRPRQPETRCCDRIGCPIKHFAVAHHAEGSIVTEARHHGS